MTKPRRYLTPMLFFVAAVAAAAAALYVPLKDAFLANPPLNFGILAVLLYGIWFMFHLVTSLNVEIAWVEGFRRAGKQPSAPRPPKPKLLAPMAALLEGEDGSAKLSAQSMTSLLDSIASRLDEARDRSRYLIALLIFLGLLGTFWGLLGTITAIGDTIRSLSVTGSDTALMWDDLKRGLEAPIAGMGTAFSSSLFGLAGSVVLGFLDLQAGQAQNRFYNDLEEWLSTQTRLSRAGGKAGAHFEGTGEGAGAYLTALMEQSSDSLDELQRSIRATEEGRRRSDEAILQLSERLAGFADQMRADHAAIETLGKTLGPAIEKLATSVAAGTAEGKAAGLASGLDEASREHLRNMDVHLKHLIDDEVRGRDELVSELRKEFKLLSRTIAALVDQEAGRRLASREGAGAKPQEPPKAGS